MLVSETSPHDWHYVSEGSSTIVFSYAGPPHQRFSSTVLRLKKTSRIDCSNSPNSEQDDDDLAVAFQHNVIERLIPSEYLPRVESVQVDKPWLEVLAGLCDAARPPERRRKDQIDVAARKAILATDLVGTVALSVELKPKWAFLPSPVHLSPATCAIKTRTCRFCMHSYLKSTTGESVAREYCPLDLFSGDEFRVTRAVKALWNDWVNTRGALNNLKIFANGKIVKPTDEHSLAVELSKLVDPGTSENCENFTKVLVPLLMNTPVLHIISKLQRTLDALDIEGLFRLKSQIELNEPRDSGLPEPCLSDWEAVVDAYTSSHDTLDHSSPSTANLRYYTLAYCLSAIFKDCSIILRLDPGSHTVSGSAVTVIDVGPKSINLLQKWEELDKEIVQAYADVEGKRCVDQWGK